MTMQEIYHRHMEDFKVYHTKRERLEALIRRHQNALEKLERGMPEWYNGAVIPLAEAISKAIEMPYKIYGPRGLGCDTSIYFFVNGEIGNIVKEPTLGLTIYPEYCYEDDAPDGFCFYYGTGERTERFRPGTIGYINGFNAVKKPLPNELEDVIQLLKRNEPSSL